MAQPPKPTSEKNPAKAAATPPPAASKTPSSPNEDLLKHLEEVDEGASFQARMVGLVKDSPFWLISLVVHIAIFVVLATIIIAAPQKKKKRIMLSVEDVEVVQEIKPMVREENLADSQAAAASAGFATTNESLAEATADTPDVTMEAIDVMGIYSPAKSGNMGEFDGTGTDQGGLNLVGRKTDNLQGAVDQFAIETLNSISKGPTLVILLIDESRSVVNKDLPIIIERMNHYFKQINLNLKPQHMGRGKWAVFSYGEKVKLRAAASSDLALMKKGLSSITPDVTGKEEILAAINTALSKYGSSGFQYILMAALTDERGTDTENDALLEKTIKRLRATRTRFFVFGREANFGTKWKKVWVTFAGQRYWSFSEQGPECPAPELWRDPMHWGWWVADTSNIPSGFPMYALNRLVLASEGIYFLLAPESKYDERKLYAMYFPDLSSRPAYYAKIRSNPLKRELVETWKQIQKMHFPHHFRKEERVTREMARALQLREYCTKQASRIAYLRRNTPPSGRNWRRWQAHADVTYCMLLRLKFLYGQYRYALMEFQHDKEYKGQIPENKRLVTHGIKTGGRYRGGRAAIKEIEEAKEALNYAFQQHRDTPWEVLLRKISGFTKGSYIWKITDLPKPGGKGYSPPPV